MGGFFDQGGRWIPQAEAIVEVRPETGSRVEISRDSSGLSIRGESRGLVRLDDTSPEVREFMDAYAANQRIAGHWCYERVVAETRRKYVLIDEATDNGVSRSGRFMVDRATGYVYAIRGYGKRGQIVGTSLAKMAADYREATATFDPARRWHAQTRGSRLNANDAGDRAR